MTCILVALPLAHASWTKEGALTKTFRSQEPSSSIILTGEFDLARDAELDAVIGRVKGASSIVVDCRAVTFLTASTLGCFVRLKKSLPQDATVQLLGLRSRLFELLKLTRLDSLFEIIDDRA